MAELVKRQQLTLAAAIDGCLPEHLPSPPILDPELEYAVKVVLADMMPVFPSNIRQRGGLALSDLEKKLSSAPPGTAKAWFWPIGDGVQEMPEEDTFMRRAAALELASIDVPGICWTKEAQRRGLAKWRTLPAVADVIDLVMMPPMVGIWLQKRKALRIISNGIIA